MKYLIILAVLISGVGHAEIVMQDSHYYNSGEKKTFSLDWSKALQLCIKIPDVDLELLKKQCHVRGGCLRVSDRTNKKGYGYNRHFLTVTYNDISDGKLDFIVSNEFDSSQNIAVTAFNPNHQVDEIFDLTPGSRKEYKVNSSNELSIFASIQVDNVNPLDEACKPKHSCLKLEYFDHYCPVNLKLEGLKSV
ncbi:MAG: hypothetical protein GY820_03925 [Gammaproteobacteria bacterium]|nr:hypothetical protein [Gammaproteobacteria bacterium]